MVIKKKKLNIVIFGSGSTIGSYLAERFYLEKHNLLLCGRNKIKHEKLKKKMIKNHSQKINFQRFDITNNNKILSFIKKNKKFIEKADLIINSTGEQGEVNNFYKINLNKFKKTFDVNFFSNVFLLKSLNKVIKSKKKLLILVFSGGGVTSRRDNFSSYSISKLALVKLVEILSYELPKTNTRINAIAPGVINSQMTRKLLKLKKKIRKKEIRNIKKEFKNSQYSMNKIFLLINFLLSKNGQYISGKLISSRWDNFKYWNKSKISKILSSDIFTLRRKIKFNEK